ncbi:MAG: nitrous oxide reductase accessory protein NosL [Sandaracinaceae bacterium]|nr:nitrous oxide reductase accessory protein NosL [Sandaracinaceae bacterium]
MSARVLRLAVVLLAAVLAAVLLAGCGPELPSGPVPVVWDHEVCAECRMHIGEPRFAAQLQTRDGEVHSFDDFGCLVRYRDAHHPEVHAIWLRDSSADRWLRYEDAAFVEATQSPMGYNLRAVPSTTAGSMTPAQAEARVRARQAP